MKASIVVPSHAGRDRLPRLLNALAVQTHQDWEAIVVVDGDIDDSQSVVEQYSHLPVRCIVLPENKGRVTALNTGFAAARGDVLIRADDDFEPYPQHIATHVAAHEEEACGAVGLPQNIGIDNAYMRAYGRHADQAFRDYAYALPPEQRWRLWGGNVSCTRETYDRVGGYDTNYKGYGWEDVDFGYRVHQLGLPIKLLKDAEVRHHMAAITTRIRALRAWDSGRARAAFDQVHGEGVSGPALVPDRTWNRGVLALAKALSRDRVSIAGSATEATLWMLPQPVGRKVVALQVEAAAWAGYFTERSEHRR